MSRPIKLSKKQKQWLWFIGLWLGGLAAVYLLAFVIKLFMNVE